MTKIAAATFDSYLVKAAAALRSQEAEIAQLKTKLAAYERRDHVEKIASVAVRRGVVSEDDRKEWEKELFESDQDLAVVEQFVNRAAGSLALGETRHEKVASASADGGEGTDVLTTFLLNNDLGLLANSDPA